MNFRSLFSMFNVQSLNSITTKQIIEEKSNTNTLTSIGTYEVSNVKTFCTCLTFSSTIKIKKKMRNGTDNFNQSTKLTNAK